jgi:hypothetical protein
MGYSNLLLILISILISGAAQATLANCPACMGEQPDWTGRATAFLEGKPIQDTPFTLSGPQQARLLNAQIDAKKKASQASNAATTSMGNSTAMLDLDLSDIRAMPNPANFGEDIKIIAVFGESGFNSATSYAHLANLSVNASIANSAGLNAARVNLLPLSGNEYSGIWNASVASDTYNVSIETSGQEGAKVFNDALQIKIE